MRITRVLYVEDNIDMTEMIPHLLGKSYRFTAVETYADALLTAKREHFNLYLIDHLLPDGTGIDLCREIRTFDRDTPIIFCSGFADDAHERMAFDAGANNFLQKPFDTDQLLAAIAHVRRRKRAAPR
jgi:Response regulators consisting of a CheY-like receiver domain and a winged-helix DNA-binding domain